MPARLVDDVLGTLVLDASNGFTKVAIDYGFPAVREDVTDRVTDDGTIDDTAFHGARAVSVTALLLPTHTTTRRAVLRRLRAFCAPSRRPILIFDEDGDGNEVQIRLRGTNAGAPLEKWARAVQATWVAPDGVLEATTTSTVTVSAVPSVLGGLSAPLAVPAGMPASATYNTTTLTNGGTSRTPPVLALWGPCTGPRLTNVTTGRTLWLPGLRLAGDQYALIDTAAATILLNGRTAENLYAYQKWGISSFWKLAPGTNLIRYEPDGYDAGAYATLTYRERSI